MIIFKKIHIGLLSLILLSSFLADAKVFSFLKDLQTLQIALESGILHGILAQEMCNCVYVVKPGEQSQTPEQRLDYCMNNANLPIDCVILEEFVNIRITTSPPGVSGTMTSKGHFISAGKGPDHFAHFSEAYGTCQLSWP